MTENKKQGVEMRRQVMGDAFVERALGNATEFSQPLQDFVNEHAWGSVWAREEAGTVLPTWPGEPSSS